MAALLEDVDIPGGRRQPKTVLPAPCGINRAQTIQNLGFCGLFYVFN